MNLFGLKILKDSCKWLIYSGRVLHKMPNVRVEPG